MMYQKIQVFFLSLIIAISCNSCDAQLQEDTPEDFIARFKEIVDSGDASRFLPELVLPRSEYRAFIEREWESRMSKSKMEAARKRLDEALQKAWKDISRGNGAWVSNGIITRNYEMEPIMKESEFYEIETSTSKEAKDNFGAIRYADITVISAKFKLVGYPNIEEQIMFPCVKDKNGEWKMVHKLHLRVLSTTE